MPPLHEPARREASPAEVGVAVGAANGFAFARDVEGIELGRLHQAHSLRVYVPASFDLCVPRGAREALVHRVERGPPALEARPVDARWKIGIRGRGAGLLNDERAILHAKKASTEAWTADADEGR